MHILLKAGAALLLTAASSAYAGNYATCLLDNLPGIKNSPATAAAINICRQKFPGQYYEIARGAGRGLLGYSSPEQCTLAKSKDTPWQPAAGMIKRSCDCLYTAPASKYDFCERYELPRQLAEKLDMSTPQKALIAETHYRKVFTAHPNGWAILNTDAFWNWMQENTDRYLVFMHGNTDQVIRLFDAYKNDNKKISGPNEIDWERGTLTAPK